MGIRLQLVNYDTQFKMHSGKSPIIVNDMPAFSEDDKEKMNKFIYTTYANDLLNNVPSCECGDTTGEYNMGVICPDCKQPVKPFFDRDLEPVTWIRAPNGVKGLINPMVWMIMTDLFKQGDFSIVNWLCDTSYKSSNNSLKIPLMLEESQLERGYNNFLENFDDILERLVRLPIFKGSSNVRKKERADDFLAMVRMYRDSIFCQYLPLPHRSLLVIQENSLGVFVDPITTGAVDAIRTLAGIDSALSTLQLRAKENRTCKAIDKLAVYYDEMTRTNLSPKEGLYRKHVFATRSHFSFRAVISSITDAHNYDDIYIPWSVAISVLRLHVMNRLMRMGFSPNEAERYMNEKALVYDPLIDRIFKKLIADTPNGRGIPATLNRNPSLTRGSIQSVYITAVKYNPKIPTVSMSIMVVRSLNADFDGKQYCCH
jgi:hypothetical protein